MKMGEHGLRAGLRLARVRDGRNQSGQCPEVEITEHMAVWASPPLSALPPQLDRAAAQLHRCRLSFLLIGLEGKTMLDRKTLWVALIQRNFQPLMAS